MCQICKDYIKWLNRLEEADGVIPNPLSIDEIEELRSFLRSQMDNHIEASVSANEY